MESQDAAGDGEADRDGKTASFFENNIAVLRDYFKRMTCNIRVLGSQLGLEPYELDDIQVSHREMKLSDQRLVLLEECGKKELIQSWEQLVTVLDKPSLKQGRIAMEIRKKYIYTKQCSLESKSSMNSPTSLEQSLGSSFSSAMMEVNHDLTIPEAVNIIMVVHHDQLLELGRNLRLDEYKLGDVLSLKHNPDEHRQRLIELWFEQEYDPEPQREKLVEALPRRESMDVESPSERSVVATLTPPSEPACDTQIQKFEVRFGQLQADTEIDLVTRNKTVEIISATLRTLPPRIYDNYSKFVKQLSLQLERPPSVQMLFAELNGSCWNWLEYELLEYLIRVNKCCSNSLPQRMDMYSREVNEFKSKTTITSFLKTGKHFKQRNRRQNKSRLRMKSVNQDEQTLSSLGEIRDDIWTASQRLSECIMQLDNIKGGCVEIEWLTPEQFDFDLIEFFCQDVGKELLARHQITKIFINDSLINNSLYVLSAAVRKEWVTVNVLLDEEDTELELNEQKEVGGRTALHHAAMHGMMEVVCKMLERGADANIQDVEGQTPVMAAVRGQHTDTVKAFLQKNPDLNIQDKNNLWSVLHIAADLDLAEILELLIQSTDEVTFNLCDKHGRTTLDIAEAKGHTQIVAILKTAIESEFEVDTLATSEGDIAAKDKESEPIASASGGDLDENTRSGVFGKVRDWFQRNTKEIRLNRAASRGSVADVQKALQDKANPNGITNKLTLRTPLMEASERGHTEVVKCLLSNGADPTMIAADNRTALIMASKGGYIDTVEAILAKKLPPETLNAAAGFWKWTALHTVAFYHGYNKQFTKDEYHERMRRITGILIEAGADPFARDRTGDTALSLASYKGYTDIVKEVLEKTPQERRKELIDHQRNDQWSALLLAARHGRHEVVRILLDAGASMTVSNKANMTALHLSIRSTDEETVKTLASKADPSAINAIDNHGYTPLIIATKLKNLKLVEVLVDAGADVNLQASKEKKTALMYAAKLNSVSIITRLVEEYKADLSLKDDKQQSARTYAGDKKVQKLMDRLIQEKEQRERIQEESTSTVMAV